MSKGLSMKRFKYIKYWFLSKVTGGTKREKYKSAKRKLKKQLYPKSVLYATLQRLENDQAYQKYYMIFKQKYNIELPADICGEGNYFELIQIKLKDIHWFSHPLTWMPEYCYLTKNKKDYESYIQDLSVKLNVQAALLTRGIDKKYDNLLRTLEKSGYNPQKSVICIDAQNNIRDGAHRLAFLLHKYGPDHEITAVRIRQID